MVCPHCGHDNIAGEDRCTNCFHSLMQVDLPAPRPDDEYQNAISEKPVSDFVTGEDLLVASPSDALSSVVDTLQAEQKSCILVYEKKHLVGILSLRDLLLKTDGSRKSLSGLKVEDVMTKNPESVLASDPVAVVVNKMAMGGFRHVPVLGDDGAPLSIVAIQDVLSYLARCDSQVNE